MTKGNAKKEHTLGKTMLSAAMLASVLATTPMIAEAAPSNTNPMEVDAQVDHSQGKVRPDAPVVFELPLNKESLNALQMQYQKGELTQKGNSKKDKAGILVRGNDKEYLATQENGQLTITTDGTTLFLTSTQPALDRNSTFTGTLLTGSAMNKYAANSKSNGKSASFDTFMASVSADDTAQQAIYVGSAVGEPSVVKADRPTGIIMTKDEAVVTFSATDDYGNPATGGSVTFTGATNFSDQAVEGVTAETAVVPFVDGKAELRVNSDQTQLVLANFELDNGFNETVEHQAPIQFVKAVEAGSEIALRYEENADGSVTVEGTAEKDGAPAVNVGIPLAVDNGTLNDTLPITDENGEFSVVVNDVTSEHYPELTIDDSIAPGVEVDAAYAAPILSGTDAWIQTRMAITESNTLIQVDDLVGEWGDDLYAKVGENGTPVKIGSGGFVTGKTGTLYLGAYNDLHSTDLSVSVTLDNPEDLGLSRSFVFASDKTDLQASSTANTLVRGTVHYGAFALVDGQVSLATTLGSFATTAVTTDANGAFTATFHTGTSAGTAQITAQSGDVTQNETIEVKKTNDLKVDLDYIRKYNYGIEYSLDEGATWKQVWIYNSFNDFVWDEANQQFIGYGRSAQMWYSKDGLKWYSSYYGSSTTFDGIRGVVVSEDGTAIAVRGTMNYSRPTTTYLDGSRYKEGVTFLKSTNGGMTWTEVFYGNNYYSGFYLAGRSVRNVAYADGAFTIELKTGQKVVSSDGGTFWTDVQTGNVYSKVSYVRPDGTRSTHQYFHRLLNTIDYADGQYTMTTDAIDGTMRTLTSPDSVTWTDVETGTVHTYGFDFTARQVRVSVQKYSRWYGGYFWTTEWQTQYTAVPVFK